MLDACKTTVLVVDDTEASRYVIGRILRAAGYTVVESATGRDALVAARNQPDLVVLDVNLPDINGFEVCTQLKSEPQTESIPVLHLSASYVRPQDQAYGLNHGADGYLTQPVEESVLIATVGALIRARRAEQAMRESDARYRTLVEATTSIVWTTDSSGAMSDNNESWGRFTGQSAAELRGFGWCDAVHPDERQFIKSQWRQRVLRGESCSLEFRLRRSDGDYRHFMARCAPLISNGGGVKGWIATCTDVSEQKLAEERVRNARDAAEAANRAKDRFLAVLSHELRTPLTPVVLGLAALEKNRDLPDSFLPDIAMIRRNIELETRLIDDLLDLSRVTTGKLRLDLQPTHVNELIGYVLENCAADMAARNLVLTRALDAVDDVVVGDAARLQQVVWNLVRNAIKFSSIGGNITVRTSRGAGGDLIVEVSDTGIGIEPEALARIFNAFEQVSPSAVHHVGGLGLGLAICRAVVEMHGGSIWAQSDGLRAGASFFVSLSPKIPTGFQSTAPSAPAAEGQPRVRARLLLVEDHLDTANVLAKLLRRLGYEVKTANTVDSALRLADGEAFDLLLSDLGLPDASGYDLMRQLRDRHAMKGIAMSGFGMEGDLARSHEAGFGDHIVKPVNMDVLEAAIRRIAPDPIDPGPGQSAR